MKKDIHPAFNTVSVLCSCGNRFETKSTCHGEIRVETCSKCHPFFTGEKRILKTSSVDKFYARQQRSASMQKK